MIISMTGFGSWKKSTNNFTIEVNFRSTNNRFFDLNMKLPHPVSTLEKEIYQLSKESCKRGSLHIYCKFETNNNQFDNLKIDKKKLDSFYKLLVPIKKKFEKGNLKLDLSFDNVL